MLGQAKTYPKLAKGLIHQNEILALNLQHIISIVFHLQGFSMITKHHHLLRIYIPMWSCSRKHPQYRNSAQTPNCWLVRVS